MSVGALRPTLAMDLRKTVISTDVTGIAFGFYSAEEIRKMSVKALTNPGSFDTLGNTIEGGAHCACLYAAHLMQGSTIPPWGLPTRTQGALCIIHAPLPILVAKPAP